MKHDSVIINHQVALSGSAARDTVAVQGINYIANRLGTVQNISEDELFRQAQAQHMDALGYANYRQGAISVNAEGQNALFNQQGIADLKSIREQLRENEGAVITSVVSVRRADAEALRLETRQDFERFLCANWSEHIERMDTIPPERIEWVAAFHVNSEQNYHAHVFTWDKEGQFDSLLPKQKMEEARQRLVYAAMEPQRQQISLERTQARDQAITMMREKLPGNLRQAIQLPEIGTVRYGSLAKRCLEAKQQVDAVVQGQIKTNPSLQEQVQHYKESVMQHANLQGLTGLRREAYIAQASDDLYARLGNAVIKQAKGRQHQEQKLASSVRDFDSGEVFLTPLERKKVTKISEELSSNLKPKEQHLLASGQRSLESLKEKCPVLNKELLFRPDLGKSLTSALHTGIAVGNLAEHLFQAAPGRREDSGEQTVRLMTVASIQAMTTIAKGVVIAARASTLEQNSSGIKLAKQIQSLN